jgi:alkylhydroperoxidase family enzyme
VADEELTPEEWALAGWAKAGREHAQVRDDLVRAALAHGVSKTRIHELTGIARTTINRIEAGQEGHDGSQ